MKLKSEREREKERESTIKPKLLHLPINVCHLIQHFHESPALQIVHLVQVYQMNNFPQSGLHEV